MPNDARDAATRQAFDAARLRLLELLAPRGVTGVIYFLAYEGYPVIWLATETDNARAEVLAAGCFIEDVRRELSNAGLSADLVRQTAVTAESQETVDRDCGGSWWAAIK